MAATRFERQSGTLVSKDEHEAQFALLFRNVAGARATLTRCG